MSDILALTYTRQIIAVALVLHGLEYLVLNRRTGTFSSSINEAFKMEVPLVLRLLFLGRFSSLLAPGLLFSGVALFYHSSWLTTGLALFFHVALLFRYRGNFGGGSDSMLTVILLGLLAGEVTLLPEVPLYWITVQMLASYIVAGWVKLLSPDWRSGEAITHLSMGKVYAIAPLGKWMEKIPRTLAYGVITLELLSPLALLGGLTTSIFVGLGAAFHLNNFLVLGLNRFFWVWLATYSCLIAVAS